LASTTDKKPESSNVPSSSAGLFDPSKLSAGIFGPKPDEKKGDEK
jgi:hypothetical protein